MIRSYNRARGWSDRGYLDAPAWRDLGLPPPERGIPWKDASSPPSENRA
jgi:hypothetical protein